MLFYIVVFMVFIFEILRKFTNNILYLQIFATHFAYLRVIFYEIAYIYIR